MPSGADGSNAGERGGEYPHSEKRPPKGHETAQENLCYNALSFTPEDGSVTLALREEEGKAAISVTDTGAGIESNHLPHVFDRGFTHRPDGSGEGMGLFIVHTIALEHGGTVEAQSQPGQGSTFTLRLPLA